MARAAVGDDVYGEDPTVNALQERVAALLGKEAALYVPSGTMANQIALSVHTRPGDEVLVSHGAHCMVFESGAAGALSGVQFDVLRDQAERGSFTAAQVAAAHQPRQPPLRADDARRRREHAQPRRRQHLPAARDPRDREGRAQASASPCTSTARASGTRTSPPVWRSRSWRRRSTPSASACPRGSARRSARSSPARRRWSTARTAAARCSAAACARRASSPPPACTRSSTTSRGSPTITPTRAASPSRWRARPASCSIRRASRPTSSSGISAPEVPIDAAAFVARAREKGLLVNAVAARRLRAVTHLDVDANACTAAAEIAAAVLRAA